MNFSQIDFVQQTWEVALWEIFLFPAETGAAISQNAKVNKI